ncbi:MAG TPA: bacteriohopanetetrol glucosamine biosynthesis glycosyltransferase HpnI [Opitutaceae bacterium]
MRLQSWLACLVAVVVTIGLGAAEGPARTARLIEVALACFFGAGALLGVGYTLLSSALIGRFFSRKPAEPAAFPAVTIVKPLRGAERDLRANLASFCRQDYPGPVQHLFGTSEPDDPALAAVEAVQSDFPGARFTVVSDSRLHGPNRKVSNLINMLARAEHDILVFADSDVGAPVDYLRRIVGELERPGVELVTCAYFGRPDPGFWPRLSAMATNYQFLPSAVTGHSLGLAHPCFGQTIALRRRTLERIGGLGPLAHHLAEDHAIGAAVRGQGGTIAIPPMAISHSCPEDSLRRLLAHELRWSRTIRGVEPLGHLGSALIHPFAFALLALLFSWGAPWAWAVVALALASRVALKAASDRALGLSNRDLWLLAPWDLVAFGIFVASHFSDRVTWRGTALKVDNRGLLRPAETP